MNYIPKVTVTEIADLICQAQGLRLKDHLSLHNRIRYLAKKGFLQDGVRIDDRGTLAFPLLEVYRAAIFADALALCLDGSALKAIQEAAPRFGDTQPSPSMRIGGGVHSRGGLKDAIRGVDAGEPWNLSLRVQQPGHSTAERLIAEFVYGGDTTAAEIDARANRIFGRKPSRAFAAFVLADIFASIIPLVGVPE